MAHLSPYPVAVIERAIERGQREWEFRPPIAKMIDQCNRALRDMPKPQQSNDPDAWKKNTKGGYTADRRPELARMWLEGRRALVQEAKANGWYFPLWQAVEDGANILAQTEWEQRKNPDWKPPPWHQENLMYDPQRGAWSIFISQEKLARWRSSRNAPVPIKGHAFQHIGGASAEAVRQAEAARDARAAE